MAKLGTYHFKRHRRLWGIWVVSSISGSIVCSDFVKDVPTYEQAVRETYSLNGWGEPKRIYKKY